MPSLAKGESSTATSPVLDLYTVIGEPPILTDIAVLEYRILDITTPAKKAVPVQVFPIGAPGTFEVLDPLTAPPTGHRLSVGHYFSPYSVPLDAEIGDYKIEWQFKLDALSPYELLSEEFFVTESILPIAGIYCGVGDVRAEGFTDTTLYPDSRILMLAELATRYIDKVTGRWFEPRTFDDTNQFKLDGKGGYRTGGGISGGAKTVHLEIPIIRIDKVYVETQGLLDPSPTEIDLAAVRIYNRHMSGQTLPDDRENPRISFIQSRITETVASGLFPAPQIFSTGRLNILLEGVFGYTDPDGSPYGKTPALIKQVACRLITRDLLLDAEACKKLAVKNSYRIVGDKSSTTNIKLQDIWLKGAFTGDSEIDNVLMMFKRPPAMGAV